VGVPPAMREFKDSGILLACISKNDEAVVRALWN
jgi:predicted enzyme involved in methoxymalonyl-ACP biosynthesis